MAKSRAMESVVEAEHGRLLRFIQRTLRDRTEAEDVLQDVFEEYAEAYDSGIEQIGAWLTRVARNKIFDRLRRTKTRDEYAQDAANFVEADDDLADGDHLLREQLTEAIDALPPAQRDVFIKNELEGRTFEEIARETGENINTLLARKRYAVKFLREYLKETHDGNTDE